MVPNEIDLGENALFDDYRQGRSALFGEAFVSHSAIFDEIGLEEMALCGCSQPKSRSLLGGAPAGAGTVFRKFDLKEGTIWPKSTETKNAPQGRASISPGKYPTKWT